MLVEKLLTMSMDISISTTSGSTTLLGKGASVLKQTQSCKNRYFTLAHLLRLTAAARSFFASFLLLLHLLLAVVAVIVVVAVFAFLHLLECVVLLLSAKQEDRFKENATFYNIQKLTHSFANK